MSLRALQSYKRPGKWIDGEGGEVRFSASARNWRIKEETIREGLGSLRGRTP